MPPAMTHLRAFGLVWLPLALALLVGGSAVARERLIENTARNDACEVLYLRMFLRSMGHDMVPAQEKGCPVGYAVVHARYTGGGCVRECWKLPEQLPECPPASELLER